MSNRPALNSGQAVLIIILTVIVGLTVAMGIFLNTLGDVGVTNTKERSERAYQTAEGAVEDLLVEEVGEIQFMAQDGDFDVDVGDSSANIQITEENTLVLEDVKQNSVVSVQLKGTNQTTSRLRIYWTSINPDKSYQNPSTCLEGQKRAPSGLLVERWTNNNGNITIQHYGYGPAGSNCANLNPDLTRATDARSDGSGYRNRINFGPVDTNPAGNRHDIVLRIQPLYNDADIMVVTTDGRDLPLQSLEIVSEASANDGEEARAIEVNRSVSDLPEIFDYVLFSGSDLVKD